MMLRKYNLNKLADEDMDDFRQAINQIVKQKDNDDIFNKHLDKKSGRVSKMNKNLPSPKRQRMMSLSIEEQELD